MPMLEAMLVCRGDTTAKAVLFSFSFLCHKYGTAWLIGPNRRTEPKDRTEGGAAQRRCVFFQIFKKILPASLLVRTPAISLMIAPGM